MTVWDLCQLGTVRKAAEWLSTHGAATSGPCEVAVVAHAAAALAVEAAVNCSSAARITPLHSAAEEGGAAGVQVCSPCHPCMGKAMLVRLLSRIPLPRIFLHGIPFQIFEGCIRAVQYAPC